MSKAHDSGDAELPDFDYNVPAALLGGETTAAKTDSSLDPSTKVIRSKSTVELRSAVNGSPVPGLEGPPAASPRTSPPPVTPSTASLTPESAAQTPAAPPHSTSAANLSTATEPASTSIRRSRSAGYNRLSGRYVESIAMHIPSPRICSVAISPTGKIVYFQTLHCKNPVVSSASAPQSEPTSPPSNPPSITSSTSSQTSSTDPNQSETANTVGSPATRSPSSDRPARKASRARVEGTVVDTSSGSGANKTPRSDSPSSETAESANPAFVVGSPEISDTLPDLQSQEDTAKEKLKDKLKFKLKDLLKDKLKVKIGKPKSKTNKPSSKEEAPGSFIGEFNLATFKIRHNTDDSARAQTGDTAAARRRQKEAVDYEGEGCSEDDYTSDSEEEGDTDDEEGAGDEPNDEEAGGMPEGASLREIVTNTRTNAINNIINSIINKDTSQPGTHLTLPFFGMFSLFSFLLLPPCSLFLPSLRSVPPNLPRAYYRHPRQQGCESVYYH